MSEAFRGTEDDVGAVASKWMAASEARDLPSLTKLISDNISVYFDFLDKTMDRAEFIGFLKAAYESPMEVEYVEKRLMVSREGFVEQATVRMTVGGTVHVIPVCVVARVAGGLIARIDEYCDPRRLPQ